MLQHPKLPLLHVPRFDTFTSLLVQVLRSLLLGDSHLWRLFVTTPTISRPHPLLVSGVILDVDGTLVLSNDAHAHAWCDAFQASGYAIPFARVRPLIGMGADQLLPRLIPDLSAESQEGKEIAGRRKTLFLQQYAPHLQAAPGARELIRHLQQQGLHLIVGSSAASDELETLLMRAQVADLLPERTTADDASSTKPAPDVVQVALQRLGLPAQQAAMLGDTPFDIQAAHQRGVPVIAVRCGGFTDTDLTGAYALYDDPHDVLVHVADLFGPTFSAFPTTDAVREQVPGIRGDEETIV
jgi:HAD superfamily hydrolase (TIGR01509 family)